MPVNIGPRTTHSPADSALTRPETSSGAPSRPIEGIAVLPPRSSVTSAPSPAAVIAATAGGSQTAATATSSSRLAITASITVITSWVPPEPTLSA